MTITEIFLSALLFIGVAGIFYVFYKLLAGGLRAFLKNDD
jgi:hypothetical protein